MTEKANNGLMLDRRRFLIGAGGLGAGAALMIAGCSPSNGTSSEASDSSSASADETVEAGFVVVGAGMAGFCAAIQAVEDGCENVVLLEKNNAVGGSTLYAEGIFGNETAFQEEQGVKASDYDEILKDAVDYSHGVINSNLFDEYIHAAPDYIKWLTDFGVSFEMLADAGSGHSCLHIYKEGTGASAIEILKGVAEDYGIDVRTSTPAQSLIVEDGAVVGVRAESSESLIDFRAPTVCLATGGIGTSEEMMDSYTRLDAGKWVYIGNQGQDGDGIKMVEQTDHGRAKNVCAQNMWLRVQDGDVQSHASAIAAMEGTNIWVNENAKRFVNEALVQDFFVGNNAVMQQGAAFSVFDQDHVAYFQENGSTCQWSGFAPFMTPLPNIQSELDEAADDSAIGLYKADTIAELAEMMGVDADALQATIDEYNADVEAKTDKAFGKDAGMLYPIKNGPFYSGKLQIVILCTLGGIRVNTEGQVTAPDGTPVEGLYAAGVCASGFTGEVYDTAAPGSCQGPAVYLGRLAGAAAAQRA